MRTAAVMLANAMTAPTERSMPPAMTTIAWATAARPMGRDARASVSRSNAPKVGWMTFVTTSRTISTPAAQAPAFRRRK